MVPICLLQKMTGLLSTMAEQIERWAYAPIIGFTHLQPAEPTTLGYRLACYAQDLLADRNNILRVRSNLRGKGFKGAVGTGAAYIELLKRVSSSSITQFENFEQLLSEKLDLPFYPVTTQTYPRRQDFEVISALAGLGSTLYRQAFDLRLLQSPPIGEVSEPFTVKQVGSSAMPFKRNPINAEKIDSLARALANMPRLAWDNAAHSLLERTLDDSANRRTLLPESFLISDELLLVATRISSAIHIDQAAMQRNMSTYGPFAGIEKLLMALVAAGADRQVMHEILRGHAMQAWGALRKGEPNPLVERISSDQQILRFVSRDEISQQMDAGGHIGDAPARALSLAQKIRRTIEKTPDPGNQ